MNAVFQFPNSRAASRSLRNRIMESAGTVECVISIIAGNCRARLDADDRFLRPDWRGAATTAKFSSRTSNRSGLETLRGIFVSFDVDFPGVWGGRNEG